MEELLNEDGLRREIVRMAEAMAEMAGSPEAAALVGIKTRGAILAERLRDELARSRGWRLPLGQLDITLYRDDLSQLAPNPLVRGTQLDFDIEGKILLLIDDVLFTGRTIRSAMDEIVDFGRPRAVRLGVMVDRGWRELPIRADYAALTVETKLEEKIQVMLREVDGRDAVLKSLRGEHG